MTQEGKGFSELINNSGEQAGGLTSCCWMDVGEVIIEKVEMILATTISKEKRVMKSLLKLEMDKDIVKISIFFGII